MHRNMGNAYISLVLLYVLGGFDTKAALARYADNCCIAYNTAAFRVHYWGINVSVSGLMLCPEVN